MNDNNSNALVAERVTDVAKFDYSTVDSETGVFLKERAKKIVDVRMKSILAIGKELAITFDKLSKVGYGEKTKTFDKWVQSIGISSRHARRHIEAYNFIVANCENINDPEKIQQSLLFAISKPSAPKELQEKVLSGDITTHKEYQAALKAQKEAEERADEAERLYKTVSQSYDNLEKTNKKHYQEVQKKEKEVDKLNGALEDMKKQLEKAKASGDTEEVERLTSALQVTDKKLSEANKKIKDLERQLKEQPIEVKAVESEEVIPEWMKWNFYNDIEGAVMKINGIDEEKINILVEKNISEFKINKAIEVLQNIKKSLS